MFVFNHRRMNYADAIVYLKEHNIKKEDGTFYEFGEVCTIISSDPNSSRILTRFYLLLF